MPSSVIQMMFYDPASRTVEVVYREGRGSYRYFDVPLSEWQEFRSAPSKGTYLNETFKGKHRYEKVMTGGSFRWRKSVLHWPDRSDAGPVLVPEMALSRG